MVFTRLIGYLLSAILFLPAAILAETHVSITSAPPYNNRRQIQVDPVEVYTVTKIIQINTSFLSGDPNKYGAKIGVNTDLLADNGGELKWIGANTNYISVVAITTVDSAGNPSTTAKPVGVSVVGDVDASGVPVKDFSVILSPGFLIEVGKIAGEACSAGKKRNNMICGVEFVPKVVSAFDAFSVGTTVIETSAVVVGAVSLKSLIANLLKDKAEKGVAFPLKVDIPHSDLIQATVTATPNAAITYTLTRIAGVIATQTSSTASACWRYIGSIQTPEPNDDDYETDADDETVDDPTVARNIAGRVALPNTPRNPATVVKRARSPPLNHIGKCIDQLITDPLDTIKIPTHPKAKEVTKKLPDSQWWFVPEPGDCGIKQLKQEGKKDTSATEGLGTYPVGYDPLPVNGLNDPNNNYANVDHVYETKILKLFFEDMMPTPDDPKCKPFFDLFNQKTAVRGYRRNIETRLQALWGNGPNVDNKAFIGMDYRINILKGRLLTPGLEKVGIPLTGSGTAYRNINLLNDIAMAFSVLRQDAPIQQFKLINSNFYRVLSRFDEIQKCSDPENTFSWAEEYKNWIPKYLKARQIETVARGGAITAAIIASGDLEKDGKKTPDGEAWESISRIFPGEFWEWPLDRLLDFSKVDIQSLTPGSFDITRRDGASDCKQPQSPSSPLPLPSPSPSSTVKPAFSTPTPPPHAGGPRPTYSGNQCIDTNMPGVKPMDRQIAIDAMNRNCLGVTFPAPSETDFSTNGWLPNGVHQQVHMARRFSTNQDGCNPRDPKLGVVFADCKTSLLNVIDNCNTDTVTKKYGGAIRWNSPGGCLDIEIWSPA